MFDWIFGRRKRDEQFLVEMMKAAGTGQHLAHLRSALSTIGVTLPDKGEQAVAAAASGLALDLIRRAGTSVRDVDGLFVGGLFTFGAANCFSYRCAVPFEETASLAVLQLVGSNPDEFARVHPAMVRDYNAMAQANSDTNRAIGQTIAAWESTPSVDNYMRLQQLFGMCLEHAKPPE